MADIKKLTQSQIMYAIPLAAGLIASIIGVIYLLYLPVDPKNSLIGGFSLFRLVEMTGLLVGAGVLGCLLREVIHGPWFSERIDSFIRWDNDKPVVLVSAWVVFLLCLFCVLFLSSLYPGWTSILERLAPVLLSVSFFSFAFTVSWLIRRKKGRLTTEFLWLWVTTLLLVIIGFVWGLILFPADTGIMLRDGSLLYTCILSIAFGFLFSRWNRWGKILGFVITALLFIGSLVGVWASGISDYNILAGLLPYNDANGYYHGGRLLAEGYPMHSFSSRRPLLPALLGVFYWIGGESLQFSIGSIVLVITLSVFFAAREINKTAGSAAAALFILELFLFIRRFIGSTMTETLGVSLGAIGFALLWSGAVRRKCMVLAAGLLMLSLGLLSRAGPFFILPILVIWAGWAFRGANRFNWKFFGLCLGAAILAFGIHQLLFLMIKSETSTGMANFSYTLYGLVTGGTGWKHYLIDHPNVIGLVEPDLSRAVYGYALEAFHANPFLTIQGAFKYWAAFFNLEWYGLFGFIQSNNPMETYTARGVVAALSLVGMVMGSLNAKKPEYSLVLTGIFGIFLSVPFVPTIDAEMRTYAAVIPWFAALGMIVFIEIGNLLGNSIEDSNSEKNTLSYSRYPMSLLSISSLLIFLMVVFPIFLRMNIEPIDIRPASNCKNGQDRVVTTISSGSYINVVPDESRSKSFVPFLRFSDIDQSIHDSPVYRPFLIANPVEPGNSLFLAYDRANREFMYVIAPTDVLSTNQGLVELCGRRGTNPENGDFFFAESAYRQEK